jgi:zinc transport system permease protein
MRAQWLENLFLSFSDRFPPETFLGQVWNVRALLAVILVCFTCSAVGSLVLGNRMAFFSDALAHCSFAGVTIGFLIFFGLLAGKRPEGEFWNWTMPIMVTFGILVGLGIVWVRAQTGQASDTVIGVFFAGAIGFAAVLRKLIGSRRYFNMEDFLFGDPLTVTAEELVHLFLLALLTGGMLYLMYNSLVFTSFNDSLARSRRVPIRLCNYLFIVLLAILVNLCLRTVGALLINAMLIVPAATARNLARNLRQLFWMSIGLCLSVGVAGMWISWDFRIPNAGGQDIQFGIGGTIVVLSVLLFAASMVIGPWWRDRKPGRTPSGLAKPSPLSENASAG